MPFYGQTVNSPRTWFISDPLDLIVDSISIPQNKQYLIFLGTEKGLPDLPIR